MKKILLLGAVVALMSSCATIGTPAGIGVFYTDVQAAGTATSNALGEKVGTSKATNILGLFSTGDASIQTAAKNAGIKKISHVDQNYKSFLGIFGTYEIFVYGE